MIQWKSSFLSNHGPVTSGDVRSHTRLKYRWKHHVPLSRSVCHLQFVSSNQSAPQHPSPIAVDSLSRSVCHPQFVSSNQSAPQHPSSPPQFINEKFIEFIEYIVQWAIGKLQEIPPRALSRAAGHQMGRPSAPPDDFTCIRRARSAGPPGIAVAPLECH